MKRLLASLLLLSALIKSNSYAQLSNPGFESTFFDGTSTVPTNWTIDGLGTSISSNSFSGSNAITLWNWYYYARAYALNGNYSGFPLITPGQPTIYGGEPISFRPDALNGYYMYDTTLNGGAIDSALTQITLSKFNSTTGTRDIIGFGELRLPVKANYTAFSVPVNYFSVDTPDTVVVVLRSSVNGFCGSASSGTCLYLTIDELTLSNSSGVIGFEDKNNRLKIYPNPSNGQFTLSTLATNNAMLSIMDAQGKTIYQKNIQSFESTLINLSDLSPGIYVAMLQSAETRISEKIIVE